MQKRYRNVLLLLFFFRSIAFSFFYLKCIWCTWFWTFFNKSLTSNSHTFNNKIKKNKQTRTYSFASRTTKTHDKDTIYGIWYDLVINMVVHIVLYSFVIYLPLFMLQTHFLFRFFCLFVFRNFHSFWVLCYDMTLNGRTGNLCVCVKQVLRKLLFLILRPMEM